MRSLVTCTLLTVIMCFYAVPSLYAAHWDAPSPTTAYMHLAGNLTINGAPPEVGDEVAVFGAAGTPIGVFVSSGATGFYGDVAINGDNPSTPLVSEGAVTGESLSIKVWKASTSREYSGDEITLSGFSGYGYQPPTFPLLFSSSSFVGVNITAADIPVFSVTTSISGDPAGGTITCTNPVAYNADSSCAISPATGYHLASFTIGGEDKLAEVVAHSYSINAITSDQTVVGSFEPDSYFLSLVADGTGSGTLSGEGTYDYNTLVTPTATPATGSSFAGWTPETCGSSFALMEDTTCTATFTLDTYILTFDSAGGSPVDAIIQDYGTDVTTPTSPTRDGYTFTAWNPDIPSTMPLGGDTLTAQWSANAYTLTFASAGGSAVDPITQDYGTSITAPTAPSRDGYTFVRWEPVVPATMPQGGATLVAQWSANSYTLTFTSAGGSTVGPITRNYGMAITSPDNPTKEGYTFVGWDPAVPATMPVGGATLTAQWSANAYTLTFDSAGGSPVDAIIQDYGTDVTTPTSPFRDGYTFTGWEPALPATMPLGGDTLTAQWSVNAYTLTIETEGNGSGNVGGGGTYNYNTTVSPYAEAFSGSSFIGWSPEKCGNSFPLVGDMTCTAFFIKDFDKDLVEDELDNCPKIYNPNQEDRDLDEIGDACDDCPDDADNDADQDGVCGNNDICGLGDDNQDADFDSVPDACDNCPDEPNTEQENFDGDSLGDACDPDDDNDGIHDDIDVNPFTPDTELPNIISGPSLSSLTDSSALISWQTNELTVGGIMFGQNSPPENVLIDNSSSTIHSVTLEGLAPDTIYFTSAFATDMATNGPVASGVYEFRTKATPDTVAPAIISGPIITSIDHQSAVVEWITSEPTTGHVYLGETDQLGTTHTDSTLTNNHRVNLENLSPATLYYVEVDAKDGANNGPTTSSTLTFTTTVASDTAAPQITAGPMIVDASASDAMVYWATDEPSNSIVTYSTGQTSAPAVDSALVTEHYVHLVGLNTTTLYTLTVSSTDSFGNGPTMSPETSFTTRAAADVEPPMIIAGPEVHVTDQSATILWETDEPASGMIVYGLATDLITEMESSVVLKQKQSLYLSGLDTETTYFYYLIATDSAGNETESGPYQLTTNSTADEHAPVILSGPDASYISDQTIVVDWLTDEPTSTVVEYGKPGALPERVSKSDLTTKHQLALKSLESNTEYRIKIIATDSSGNTTIAEYGQQFTYYASLDSFVAQTSVFTKVVPDVMAPLITDGPELISRSDTTAVISWQTDEIGDSLVRYGLSGAERNYQMGNTLDESTHTIVLTNLAPNTEYDFTVESVDPDDNGPTVSSVFSFTTLTSPDSTAPVITSPPVATVVKTDRATIEWGTDEASSTTVNYGEDSENLALTNSAAETTRNHAVTLTGLIAGTTYYYEVVSKDLSGNSVTSSQNSFTTTGMRPDNEATGALLISGTAEEGGTLTSQFSDLNDPDGATTVSYQWQDQVGGSWTDLTGETSTSLSIPSDQSYVGKVVRVTAISTDPFGGTTSFTSNASAAIANVNDTPIVVSTIDNQNASEGVAFGLAIPVNTFSDAENEALTLSAALANGDSLPAWLSFNASTGTLSGTPGEDDGALLSIRVTAMDPHGARAFTTFRLDVETATTDIQARILQIYAGVWETVPDAQGLDYWTNTISSNQFTYVDVATSFFDQPLVQEKYSDNEGNLLQGEAMLAALYRNLFKIETPDDEGFDYWMCQVGLEPIYDKGCDFESGNPAYLTSNIGTLIMQFIDGMWANPAAAETQVLYSNFTRAGRAFYEAQVAEGVLYTELTTQQQQAFLSAARALTAGLSSENTDEEINALIDAAMEFSETQPSDWEEGNAFNTVTSPTGRVWMDRNLGASQVATAYNDAAAYGDLYQWGRGTDGHEKRTSPTTTTLSSSDTPGHGSFITNSSSPYDWRSPQNDTLWQGVSGVNNPCPSGFRLPTIADWEAERATWSTDNRAGAFASPLKLVSAGYRSRSSGTVLYAGSFGYYWSSSVDGSYARDLSFSSGNANAYNYSRASGLSVRCLED